MMKKHMVMFKEDKAKQDAIRAREMKEKAARQAPQVEEVSGAEVEEIDDDEAKKIEL